MRGLKRKHNGGGEEKNTDYKENLSHFQTLARQRESIRLKNQCMQVANSILPGFWEKHLNEKIQIESQMIQGTAKFMVACKNEDQALEAAKKLQLGKIRLDMLKYELSKLKRGRASPNLSNSMARPSYAGISISGMLIVNP